ATIFAFLCRITSRQDERYPCCAPEGHAEKRVRALLGETPPRTASDGIVPLYSQIWGELLWVGKADHLDIVGHFEGLDRRGEGPFHTDWLASGSRFNRVRFDVVMDRIVDGMIVAEELRGAAAVAALKGPVHDGGPLDTAPSTSRIDVKSERPE